MGFYVFGINIINKNTSVGDCKSYTEKTLNCAMYGSIVLVLERNDYAFVSHIERNGKTIQKSLLARRILAS